MRLLKPARDNQKVSKFCRDNVRSFVWLRARTEVCVGACNITNVSQSNGFLYIGFRYEGGVIVLSIY